MDVQIKAEILDLFGNLEKDISKAVSEALNLSLKKKCVPSSSMFLQESKGFM